MYVCCNHILDVSSNEILLSGLNLLTDALVENPTFESLVADNNEFGSRPHVSYALEKRKNVHHRLIQDLMRDLDKYKLRGRYVSPNLEFAMSLTNLSLAGSGIGDDFAEELCHVLRDNKVLQRLNLSGNNIGPHGAECIASALRANRTLRVLNLSNNRVDDTSGTHSELGWVFLFNYFP